MSVLKNISIQETGDFKIGNYTDLKGGTGCTVILSEKGAVTGCDVRGGAPASRENALLNPLAANDSVNAVVLSGGSAFGLDCCSGVMKYLEEKGAGFQTSAGVVPIVAGSCIYDLSVGEPKARPSFQNGYDACLNAMQNNYQDGNFGCGTGATCGKMYGPEYMMKSGIGSCAYQIGDLKVGAIVAVNCAGDVFENSRIIAGAYHSDKQCFMDCEEALYSMQTNISEHTNTTIGCILTNARLDKTALAKVCGMGHDGMARAINPVHTMYDGDTLYAMSDASVISDINIVGTLAARCVEKAIIRAVKTAEPVFHLLSTSSIASR